MGKSRRYDPRDDDYGNRDYFFRKKDKFRQRRQKRLRTIISKQEEIDGSEPAEERQIPNEH